MAPIVRDDHRPARSGLSPAGRTAAFVRRQRRRTAPRLLLLLRRVEEEEEASPPGRALLGVLVGIDVVGDTPDRFDVRARHGTDARSVPVRRVIDPVDPGVPPSFPLVPYDVDPAVRRESPRRRVSVPIGRPSRRSHGRTPRRRRRRRRRTRSVVVGMGQISAAGDRSAVRRGGIVSFVGQSRHGRHREIVARGMQDVLGEERGDAVAAHRRFSHGRAVPGEFRPPSAPRGYERERRR
mmetsp:Transcript_39875/g.120016  ORF Transcript_39875/g.120016 Transcript_39875/m.120016 type:complete len:238 (+) Transcript_39875:454-1167(+)